MLSLDDTICAVASAPGGAARGIVRMSGLGVVEILDRCYIPDCGECLPSVRTATALSGRLSLGLSLGEVPCELFLWPTASSYTRQPTAELHTFGSPPILSAILRSLCRLGARPAEPGEFTLRAFLAGRLDLTQAEAVLGVIDAAGPLPLEAALKQLAGGMSQPLNAVRESLLQLLAHLEAGLDFVEEDIEFVSQREVDSVLGTAQKQLAMQLLKLETRSASTEQPRIVLVGPPNAGKSSLFNALLGKDAAIVSCQPGTTRDYISASFRIGQIDCELIDTAGLDSAPFNPGVEASAQAASEEARSRAHIELLCQDATQPFDFETQPNHPDLAVIFVLTKSDQVYPRDASANALATSSITGYGLESLRDAIAAAVGRLANNFNVAEMAARCRDSIRLAADSLIRAGELNAARHGEELIAAEIRVALAELGKVVGVVYTDDILDRIFSRFCIGK